MDCGLIGSAVQYRDCTKRVRMSTISRQFEIDGEKIAYWTLGDGPPNAKSSGRMAGDGITALSNVAGSWAAGAFNILIDFPGFGASPRPRDDWGTAESPTRVRCCSSNFPDARIWVGHSFGCRVGIQLAARHGSLIDGLFLVAAAGLPRRRSLYRGFACNPKSPIKASVPCLSGTGPVARALWQRRLQSRGRYARHPDEVVNEDLSPQAKGSAYR